MRPKNADSAITQETILTAAAAIIDADGPNGLSLRAVARKAGLSPGTLSYYFSSLETLLEACLDAYYERLSQLAQRHVIELGTKSASEVAAAAARDLYRFALRERPILMLQMAVIAQRGGLNAKRRQGHHHGLLHTISVQLGRPGVALQIQTLVFAAFRYVCSSDEDLLMFTGADSVEEAHNRVEAHLAGLAMLVFGRSGVGL